MQVRRSRWWAQTFPDQRQQRIAERFNARAEQRVFFNLVRDLTVRDFFYLMYLSLLQERIYIFNTT